MSEQLSERGKDLVKYMPQAVNALADRLIEKLTERVLYGEKPKTNADRIRQMSNEELAEWIDKLINHCYEGTCVNCFMQEACQTSMMAWLKSPVEEGEG